MLKQLDHKTFCALLMLFNTFDNIPIYIISHCLKSSKFVCMCVGGCEREREGERYILNYCLLRRILSAGLRRTFAIRITIMKYHSIFL